MKFKEFSESLKTPCQTPGAIFHTHVSSRKITATVDLPADVDLSKEEATILEKNIHNALEQVLAKHFK